MIKILIIGCILIAVGLFILIWYFTAPRFDLYYKNFGHVKTVEELDALVNKIKVEADNYFPQHNPIDFTSSYKVVREYEQYIDDPKYNGCVIEAQTWVIKGTENKEEEIDWKYIRTHVDF